MSGRSITKPASVSTEVISDSTEMNCWSNPSTSIWNQVAPDPGSGTARNTKMMIAVPIRGPRRSGAISSKRRRIRKTTIAMEPRKMIS